MNYVFPCRWIATLAILVLGFIPSSLTGIAADAASTAAQAKLIQIENDICRAYVADFPYLDRLMTDDYLFISEDGSVRTKAQELMDLKSGVLKVTQLTAEEMKVRIHGTTAVVTGVYGVKSTTDGKDTSGRFSFTDVFVEQGGTWRWLSTHASKVLGK